MSRQVRSSYGILEPVLHRDFTLSASAWTPKNVPAVYSAKALALLLLEKKIWSVDYSGYT
ncbi:hypothetical protein GN958_ATG14186 [Phytophthora infestans]|uniref:Uncharacterized protein n=1 Tax=Phytophthora infestans TaxID=4787 RepID=A0A8S9UAS8_PHYIN|nr:hypothetical protein GN958_ATG14184 [Phytophthora infestans]KAF4136623.1 hypothetical protein GN958_ATG14185 [Phytophthora infestans]KAF4136624.1 hypothetical protein GN958_ATG14186 [Phytophthora infestans]